MATDMFIHAVRMVLEDWRTSLRITGLLYLVCAIPNLLVTITAPTSLDLAQSANPPLVAVTWLSPFLTAIFTLWIAVAWHRYVLLDERPRAALPSFHGRRMMVYFGIGFALLLIIGVPLMPVFLALGVVTYYLGPWAMPVLAIPIVFVGLLVFYRLSPLLPAAAVGRSLQIGEAWQATKGAGSTLIGLALLSALVGVLISLPNLVLIFLGPIGQVLSAFWTLVVNWLVVVVGASVLTTVYGHYVEGRPVAHVL